MLDESIEECKKYVISSITRVSQCEGPYADTALVVEAFREASFLGDAQIQRLASSALVGLLLLPNGLRSVLSVYLDGTQ